MSKTATFDKVICFIRKTKEWHEKYNFSQDYLRNWKADLISDMWNKKFKTSYIDFRRQLNDLQIENLKDINFSYIVNQYEYIHSDNSIIAPMDDDDWFHPDIINTLKDIKQSIVFWNFANYTNGEVTVKNPAKEHLLFTFESNNYALHDPDEDLLLDHTTANKRLKNVGFHVDATLSIHNRSLASLSLLKLIYDKYEITGKNDLLDSYEICRNPQILDDIPLYFLKYIDKMKKIYASLKIRKIFL